MLSKARAFALHAHGDQQYGDRPYAFHLDMVVRHLAAYGEQAQIIGYLHDVLEDTATSAAQLEAEFGPLVAACVALLSDQPGATRQERKAKTYAKLAQLQGPTQLALLVKTADRLANVKSCVADGEYQLWQVYRGEQPSFKQAAYRPGMCEPLWAELELLLEASVMTPPDSPAQQR